MSGVDRIELYTIAGVHGAKPIIATPREGGIKWELILYDGSLKETEL